MTILIEESKPLLDIVRQAEAVVTKQLAAARKAAEKEMDDTRQQARKQIDLAILSGKQEGEAQRQYMLDEADQEAQEIVSQALQRAEALRSVTQAQKEIAVQKAVAIVIGEDSLTQQVQSQEKKV